MGRHNGGSSSLDQNGVDDIGIITQGSLTVGQDPRRLTTGFVLLLGLAYDFSNGSSATKRPPVGVATSPRAHRLLEFVRGSKKT
jgi:hypothetical protein